MKCSFLLFIEALIALPAKERMGFELANASLRHYWVEPQYRECGSDSSCSFFARAESVQRPCTQRFPFREEHLAPPLRLRASHGRLRERKGP